MVIRFDYSVLLLSSLVCAAVAAYLRRKRGKSLTFLIFYSIFFFYIVAVINYTQFPIFLTGTDRASRNDVLSSINLVPLVGLGYADIRDSLRNVVMTMPFGFGLPFVASVRFRGIVSAGLMFSVFIETLQLLPRLIGTWSYRVTDSNDVLFNTLGAAVGYLAFVAVVRVSRLAAQKLPSNPILLYIAGRPQVPGFS